MTVRNLEKIFRPENVAVIGASNTPGSVGYVLFNNLISSGYNGIGFPVNPKHRSVQGVQAFSRVSDLPRTVDLALIATPAQAVPGLVRECGECGIRGIIIVSAGFSEMGEEGKELIQQINESRRSFDQRIIGPNCLGVIQAETGLNASFANSSVRPGGIAFISQSGALGTATLDWAFARNIGFSSFVSVGNMMDVGFGDLIDYFGSDPRTRSIILYIESLKQPSTFMSAARGFAVSKPVVVVKSGRMAQGARAAASHTGAMAGLDSVYDAAFARAGVVRVTEISDLFQCAEILPVQSRLTGNRLAIITNAGGPGVMATDRLTSEGGELAVLSERDTEKLDQSLPEWWSGRNPVDVLGDAAADRYDRALDICLASEQVDAVLVILTPQEMTEPEETARKVADHHRNSDKPVLAAWMGETLIEGGRNLLQQAGVPCYQVPEYAVDAFMNMSRYKTNIELLYQTPEALDNSRRPQVDDIKKKLKHVADCGRTLLSERESKDILHEYGIPVTETRLAKTTSQAQDIAEKIGFPVVMKIESNDITHKSDSGCVVLNVKNSQQVRDGFDRIIENARMYKPDADIQGVTLQEMITRPSHEVIVGVNRDAQFGAIILFGAGGVAVELIEDRAIGFPPLNQTLAQQLIRKTRMYTLLKEGWRNIPAADIREIEKILIRFSRLIIDLPEIKEIDINPLLASSDNCVAADARMFLDDTCFQKKKRNDSHLVLTPYPVQYVKQVHFHGTDITFRPIRPEDEPLWLDMFRSFSEETRRQRFFHVIRDMPHSERIRYTFNDYAREIAIVAEIREDGETKFIGVARMNAEGDPETAEFAIVLRDQWQGLGLGELLFDFIMDIAREKGWKQMVAGVLKDNKRMIRLFRKKKCAFNSHPAENYYDVRYTIEDE